MALPTDVQRNGKAVREAFEEVFLAMVGLIEQNTRGRPAARRERAQAIAAMCIGGLIVARTVGTHTVADQLRQACMDVALGLLETR